MQRSDQLYLLTSKPPQSLLLFLFYDVNTLQFLELKSSSEGSTLVLLALARLTLTSCSILLALTLTLLL